MESLMIIILAIILIICVFAIFYATIYNKFQDYIIRINEVEAMIDTNLRNKYDLYNKVIPIIKGSNKDKTKEKEKEKEPEIFSEIVKLRSRKIGNFELYRILGRADAELIKLENEINGLDKNEDIKKIKEQIEEINLKIDNATQYYNDNITIYNTLLKKFPSNLIAACCKYKEKLFFDRKDMSDEDYDDFKL